MIDDTKERKHHVEHGLPLGTFLIGDESIIDRFSTTLPDLKFAWSYKDGYDVFLKDINKSISVNRALKESRMKKNVKKSKQRNQMQRFLILQNC